MSGASREMTRDELPDADLTALSKLIGPDQRLRLVSPGGRVLECGADGVVTSSEAEMPVTTAPPL